MVHSFPTHFSGKAPKKRFSSLSQSLSGELLAWSIATHSLLLGRLHYLPRIPRPPTPPSHHHHAEVRTNPLTTWSWSLTSSRSRSKCWRSPPSAWPALPSSPWRCQKQWKTLSDLLGEPHYTEGQITQCVSSPSFTIPEVGSHLLTCLLPCELGIRFHMENTFLLDNYGIP